MEEIQSESGEKEVSLWFSNGLAAKGMTLLLVTAIRQGNSYDVDISNAFNLDTQIILSGSRGDGVGLYYGYGTVGESSDLDVITVYKELPVSESDTTDNDWIVKIPEPQSIGYVKLKVKRHHPFLARHECVDGEYISSRIFMDSAEKSMKSNHSKLEVHGPAISVDLPPNVIAESYRKDRSIPTVRIDDPSFKTKCTYGADKTDNVFGLESETWPAEAEEWRTRKRQFDWPKRELVDQIVQTGCILVPVGHKESPSKDLQWRISFNKAESMLTGSFNETQLQCYILLKLLNTEILKRVSRGNITSYITKSTLFWVSESMPQEEWQPETLIKCLLKCISGLLDWIKTRYMPNYFIVKRNMFLGSELTDDVVHDTILALDRITNDPVGELCQLEFLRDRMNCSMDEVEFTTLFVEVVLWLKCRYKMAEDYYFAGNQILYQACEYNNVPQSIDKCETVLENLTKLGLYAKPMSDLVQNYLAVLHYANAMKQENVDCMCNEKEKAMKYFDASKKVDFTNAPLRMATCLLMDKRYNEALGLIKEANANIANIARMPHYLERIESLYNKAVQEISKLILKGKRLNDLQKIHHIAKRDIRNQNLQQTIHSLMSKNKDVANVLTSAWTYICFDVIFTSAEITILPKPVQLEAMKKDTQIKFVPIPDSPAGMVLHGTFILTLDPRIYACYLRFLCNLQMGSSKDVCKRCLFYLNRAITEGPEKHRPLGFNLLSYCCLQLDLYRSAAICLIKSLRMKPDDDNVAYNHFQTIIGILMKIDNGSNKKDNNQDQDLLVTKIIYQLTNQF